MTNRDTTYDNEEITNYVCLNSYKRTLSETKEKDYVSSALKVGSICLGKYKILKVLNNTQFGFVYLVEKNNTDKKRFIIKEFFPKASVTRGNQDQMLIKSSLSMDELQNFNFLKKIFMGEVEKLSTLSKNNHPNIISLIEFKNNINNTAYIVTSYEEGMSLKAYLEKRNENTNSKLTNDEIIKIVYQLIDTIEDIHSLGIFHLNIKPENIFIKKDGTPLLIDFKASVIFYDEDKDAYCNAYTPRYASPEQITQESPKKVEQTSDVYALGMVFYHLITNTFPPPAHERIKSIVINKEEDPYVSIFEHVFSIDFEPSLLKAIDKALSFSKKDRFQSAHDFKNAILGKNPTSMFKLKMEKKSAFYLLGLLVPLVIFFNYFNGKDFDSKSGTKVVQVSNVVIKNKTKDVSTEQHLNDHELKMSDKMSVKPVEAVEQLKTDSPQEKETIPNIVKQNINTVSQIKKSSEQKNIVDNTKLVPVILKQQTASSEMIKEINVKINIALPMDIGKTKLKVNGKELFSHELIAQKNQIYDITIENPYYQTINVKRTFDELKEFPEQTFIPILGKGKLYLSGLASSVNIKVYEFKDTHVKEANPSIIHRDGIYEIILIAGKKFYMTFEKKGYKLYKTDTFILKHGKALAQTYSLEKKDVIKKPKNTTTFVSNATTSLPKEKKKIKKTKTNNKIQKSKQKASSKKIKTVTSKINKKIKKEKKSVKKSIVKTIKNKSEIKKKTSTEKRTKKQVSSHVWYCHAKAVGMVKVSAKDKNKQVAKRMAIQKCKNLSKENKRCQIMNCFLLRR